LITTDKNRATPKQLPISNCYRVPPGRHLLEVIRAPTTFLSSCSTSIYF